MPNPSPLFRTSLFLAAGLAAGAAWSAPEEATARPSPSAVAAHRKPAPEDQEIPDPEPGSGLRVSLVTVGTGPAVFEMFGHNALRIRDPDRGLDVSYNWGVFDTGQEGFLRRFLLGDWRYWMAGLPSERMIARYAASDRGVVEQELDLSPERRLALLAGAELNARPENRVYRYQYFLDNCSTRVRDVLDAVLDGRLRERFGGIPGETYRFHTRRLTAGDPLIYASLDFFMSGRGDRPVTAWDEMFVPMVLRDLLRETGLVASETVVDESSRPRPLQAPPRRFALFALAGAALAAALAGSAALASPARAPRARGPRGGGRGVSKAAKAGFVLVAGTWSLAAGLAGLVMIASHFTSHEFMHWNENFLQANPFSLALAGALAPAAFAGRWRRLAAWSALLAAGASALGFAMQLLPGLDQVNGYYLAVAMPTHAAVAWGVRRVAPRSGESIR